MEDLSLEVLERIVKRLDHISMCHLALMSTHMRKGVHSYCSSHLRQLAEQDSSTAASLEACGWVAGNDHDIWECSCIHLVVGPWHYWVKGTRRKEEVIVEDDANMQVGVGCAVVKNKLFICPNASSVAVRTRGHLADVVEVANFSGNEDYPLYEMYLTNFENTLVVKLLKPEEYDYTVTVYNADIMDKVCDLDIMTEITDSIDKSNLEVPSIVMCKNRIIIHLLFNEIPDKNLTQIWALDTDRPQAGTILLVKTLSHPLSLYGALDPGYLAINSRYLARIGTPDRSNNSTDNIIQYFHTNGLQINGSRVNFTTVKDSNIIDHQKMNVRQVSIIPGEGSILCLGLELDISHRNSYHSYQAIIQLFDLSSEKVVAQKDLGRCHHIEDKLKMCWWSENLVLLVRETSYSAGLYTWSPGQLDILETGLKLPLENINWAFEYFHVDYQGIVTAKDNVADETTVFQCFTYESQAEGGKFITTGK